MVTITLELDDNLAERLQDAGEHLPNLLTYALDTAGIPGVTTPLTSTTPAWIEAVDFLAQTPTQQQIIDFKLSSSAQERMEELLDGHRNNNLTPMEREELETYRQINHLFIILKARARKSLNND